MEKELIKRLEDSVSFIQDGITFGVGNMALGKDKKGTFFVIGYSNYMFSQNMSNDTIKLEFESFKADFLELVAASTVFKNVIDVNKMDYYLNIDYGPGSFPLAVEINGEFKIVRKE